MILPEEEPEQDRGEERNGRGENELKGEEEKGRSEKVPWKLWRPRVVPSRREPQKD